MAKEAKWSEGLANDLISDTDGCRSWIDNLTDPPLDWFVVVCKLLYPCFLSHKMGMI